MALGSSLAHHARNHTEWKNWVSEHNRRANRTWTAKLAKGITYEDEVILKSMIGASLSPDANSYIVGDAAPKRRLLQSFPANYDLRLKYPKCASLTQVRNQLSCGACWAFSTMTSLSDRTCIKTYSQSRIIQRSWSYQDLLECCDVNTCGTPPGQGCNGGFLDGAFSYAMRAGVVTGEAASDTLNCKPFFLSNFILNAAAPSCRNYCTNGRFAGTYQADRMKILGLKAYSTQTMTMDNVISGVKDAMLRRGTLVAGMTVHADFYTYSSGIYVSDGLNYVGQHAVRMIGWGTENGTPYWIMANSWGPYWGDKGFFKIIMGRNESMIENYIIEGIF